VICCCDVRIIRLCVLVCCGVLAQAQGPQSIDEVRTIFVDTLGQSEADTVIRDKIINRLAASGRFQVAADPDKADAVLTGSASANEGRRGWDMTTAVRLVTKDQRILWVSEAKNGRFARSASSSVADHIVKDLLKAAKKK
jgi:hypothetical protein